MGEDVVAEQDEHLVAADEALGETDRLSEAARLLLQLVGELEPELAP